MHLASLFEHIPSLDFHSPRTPCSHFSSHVFQWHKCHHKPGEVRRCDCPPFPHHVWPTTIYRSSLACRKWPTSISEHVWNECGKLQCHTIWKKIIFISKIWRCWFYPLTHSLTQRSSNHTVKCTKICVQVVWLRWFSQVRVDKGYQPLEFPSLHYFFSWLVMTS